MESLGCHTAGAFYAHEAILEGHFDRYLPTLWAAISERRRVLALASRPDTPKGRDGESVREK